MIVFQIIKKFFEQDKIINEKQYTDLIEYFNYLSEEYVFDSIEVVEICSGAMIPIKNSPYFFKGIIVDMWKHDYEEEIMSIPLEYGTMYIPIAERMYIKFYFEK